MDFDGFSWKINEISWIFRISQGVVGNLGVEVDHPPKMCAGLALRSKWTSSYVAPTVLRYAQSVLYPRSPFFFILPRRLPYTQKRWAYHC